MLLFWNLRTGGTHHNNHQKWIVFWFTSGGMNPRVRAIFYDNNIKVQRI